MKKLVYRYYCPFRPPMPGAIPRQGLDRVGCYDAKQSIGNDICAWGYAEYTRALTDQEIYQYELIPSRNNPLEYD